jgi:hypothetical protein
LAQSFEADFMAAYPRLQHLVLILDPRAPENAFTNIIVPYMVDVWLEDYARTAPTKYVVKTKASAFNYLFDISAERLIAAWGVSRGRHTEARDKARMAGHPNSAGPRYHRGHAIPHTLGGPTDINLVPQLGSVNVGPFRELEKRAVATPGALYFTYWIYAGAPSGRGGYPSQKPTAVEQGLLIPGQAPQIHRHAN